MAETNKLLEETANYLLNHCFLLGGVEDQRSKYLYVQDHLNEVRAVFAPLGYAVLLYPAPLQAAALVNEHEGSQARLLKYESILLLVLRLLYLQKRESLAASADQVLGTVEDIPVLMEKENVDEIVLAVESKNNKALLGILYSLYRYKRPIKVLADRFNMLSKIQLRTIRGIPLVDVTDNNFSPAEQNIKLFLDKVCSVVALLLLSPLFAYIAWRVKKDSPGPVFFRQERIGYLGHDPELFFDSVENNILLGDKKEADDYLKAVCMEQETAEMADGKKTVVGNGGVRLSGGQAKRLALARTLCHKKPVLILDDPFSALDKSTERQIFANLKQQTKDNIVFLISHRLYLFPQMDQVIWMEDGKAVAGTHEEILEKIPEYRSLYETQSDERENAKVETENRKTVSEHTEERRSDR